MWIDKSLAHQVCCETIMNYLSGTLSKTKYYIIFVQQVCPKEGINNSNQFDMFTAIQGLKFTAMTPKPSGHERAALYDCSERF